MGEVKERDEVQTEGTAVPGISLADLADRLGAAPAQEFFERIDLELRKDDVVLGTNVRAARNAFTRARHAGNAQIVIPGQSQSRAQSSVDISEGVVMMTFLDLEAVVKAAG